MKFRTRLLFTALLFLFAFFREDAISGTTQIITSGSGAFLSLAGGTVSGGISVNTTTAPVTGVIFLGNGAASLITINGTNGVIGASRFTNQGGSGIEIGASNGGIRSTSATAADVSGGFNGVLFQLNGILSFSSSVPTVSSGFGSSPSVTGNTLSFDVNVGTGGVATNGVIGLPTATTGWTITSCSDITTQSSTVFYTHQISSTTATASIANFNTAGAQAAWAASDHLRCSASAY